MLGEISILSLEGEEVASKLNPGNCSARPQALGKFCVTMDV
jgi:hypothetical protein